MEFRHLDFRILTISEDLLLTLKDPALGEYLEDAREHGNLPKYARRIPTARPELKRYGEATIVKALEHLINGFQSDQVDLDDVDPARAQDREAAVRQVEQGVLCENRDERAIVIQQRQVTEYGRAGGFLQRMAQVQKLRETRVLAGFTRVTGQAPTSDAFRRNLMWREPDAPHNDWLPAHIVHGEGLYFELNHERLRAWEEQQDGLCCLNRVGVG